MYMCEIISWGRGALLGENDVACARVRVLCPICERDTRIRHGP